MSNSKEGQKLSLNLKIKIDNTLEKDKWKTLLKNIQCLCHSQLN